MKPIYEPKGAAKEYGDYAINIYTGCPHRCFYCVDENTHILTAEMRSVPIKDIKIGDKIIGAKFDGKYWRFSTSIVLNKFSSVKDAYLVRLADGTEIVCSGDHRWLTRRRGWKYTIGAMNGESRRPFLTKANEMMGYGKSVCASSPIETDDYKRGYLYGIISGDGTVGHYKYERRKIHYFRLAMQAKSAIYRAKKYLTYFGIEVHQFVFKSSEKCKMPAIRTGGEKVGKIENLISPTVQDKENREYLRGFMAGFYDAEGSSSSSRRAYNTDEALLSLYKKALNTFGFSYRCDDYHQGKNKNVKSVRICGGLSESIRFRQVADVAIYKKFSVEGATIKNKINTKVVSVEKLNESRAMVDITTTTGNFIANGCVAHNCFAPNVLHRDREEFHSCVKPREGIVKAVKEQIEREQLTGKLVHLCCTCAPYPSSLDREQRAHDPIDTTPTREIIKLLKDGGNNVQILTKNPTWRDFDLLDENDWFGVTYDGGFRIGGFIPCLHMPVLEKAHKKGIKTWISFEPVVCAEAVLEAIEDTADYVDKIKIGKLNYHKSDINWKQFGEQAEALCKELGLDYYIKDSLRKEMKG